MIPHGGTDAGPTPVHDFSTNANALGPSPMTHAAVRAADASRYPDPAYGAVRSALAALHGRDPADVVVGAGVSELIHRIVRVVGGPVAVMEPTFGEYRHAAGSAGAVTLTVRGHDELVGMLDRAAVAFLCVPNSPDGATPDEGWLAETAQRATRSGCRLVLDLAYLPLAQRPPAVPPGVWQLWAPNKAHGMTGIRAGYLLVPPTSARRPGADARGRAAVGLGDAAERLRDAAPSWVVSAHGVAFLHAVCRSDARSWVATTRRTLWAWRDELADGLRAAGVDVTAGAANFLLAHVGDAAAVTARLRGRGIRVRDGSSFGLSDAVRLSAQPPVARTALLAALSDVCGQAAP